MVNSSKIGYCIVGLISLHSFCVAQNTDSLKTIELKNIVITSYKDEPLHKTALNITTLKVDSLARFGNFNLTDLMARTPGVTALSTGLSIAKPVIRGLYGNRVLMLVSGLKFDNQQWQEEHGLGLSDIGISKVEIVKGPMSVLYGTEAIGGIINVIEEDKPAINTKESDVGIRLNSNTLGGLLQAGYKVNKGNKWFRIRAAVENNADYTDGDNKRILNSRFDGYNLKATYGFSKKNWTSTNNYLGSFNRYGFIFNDIYTFITPDKRWSRRLNENPAHLVLFNILSSENKITLKNNSKLNVNVGVQSNERMENEGGGAISLNMHLFTAQYLIKWEKQLTEKNRLILSNLSSFENNTNFGARKIIPDANMQESNVSAYLETEINTHLILENGIGGGQKYIHTFLTPTVNSAEKQIKPFVKLSPYYNAFTGITYFTNNGLNIKANIATGVRVPNLAELSSNGLHEGIFTYEIGNPNLKNEQNIALNVVGNYQNKWLQLSLSPFYNYFYNYVYLAPTNDNWFGFPIYRYKQQNVTQFGTEALVGVKPHKNMVTSIAYSGMISQGADGNFTPYIPAQKITTAINYIINNAIKNNAIQLFTNLDYYDLQINTAPFENSTPAYFLWNAGVSSSCVRNSKTYSISITGNNLLNNAYYDHLSRFKNFGLLNIGRNIGINIKIKFNK